ncbi:MAG: InlB B-repeat-containing protein [Treponema sp.]|nr:InlB B-repeat-containing protein [Treponema sp.]
MKTKSNKVRICIFGFSLLLLTFSLFFACESPTGSSAKTYTVEYDANGGEGQMEKSVFKVGVLYELPANGFTRSGHSFTGWALAADGSVVYPEEAEVIDLAESKGTITLYAVWLADMDIIWPADLAAVVGWHLSDILLTGRGSAAIPGEFTWTNPDDPVGSEGVQTHNMTFTPEDTANYSIQTRDVLVTVVSEDSYFVAWPVGVTAVYGQRLSEVYLFNMGYSTVPGRFTWTTPTSLVGGVGMQTHNMTFTPDDRAKYEPLTGNVNVIVNRATPAVTVWPAAETIIYGQQLSESALTGGTSSVPGTFAWTDSTIVPTVTNSGYEVTFTPNDAVNYNAVTQEVEIDVNKANPTVTWPVAAAIIYGQQLSESALTGGTSNVPGTFAWTDGTIVPAITNSGYEVTFTPDDADNYNAVTNTVAVTVNIADPTVTWPVAATITYGQQLSESVLTGGTSDVDGTFAWTDGTIVPTVTNSGYAITFTPDDTNYNTLWQIVVITVNKANPTVTWPVAAAITYGQQLSDSVLTGGASEVDGAFTWTDGTIAPAITNSGYEVTFTPDDADNYNAVTNTVAITVNIADPTVTWPVAAAITYGQQLSASALTGGASDVPGTFAWTDGTIVPAVANSGYSVTFTPDDTNYNTLWQIVAITVNKTDPTVTWPVAAAITYGQQLSASALTGGTSSVPGTFAWTDGTIAPTVTNSGYEVTFTPDDAANYNAVTQNVALMVYPRPVTISGGTPSRALIPFGSDDMQYGKTTTIDIIINGLLGSDTVTVGLAANSLGLSRTAGSTVMGIGGASWTLEYNATAPVVIPAVNTSLTVSGLSGNYTLSGSPAVGVTIFDGQEDYTGAGYDRRIPVTYSNLNAFLAYVNTTNGLGRHYKLVGNINLIPTWQGGDYWTPIGTYDTPFTGSFDGQGAAITNMTVDSTGDYQGMFGFVGNGGIVRNLNLQGGSVTGGNYVGGVVGANNGGMVQNCYFTGSITGTGNSIGGVVGYTNGGTIQNCYSTGSVNGDGYVGGVVGLNGGTVQNCYFTGSVNGDGAVGGVVGINAGDTVQNCYSTGSITGGFVVGGVVGRNWDSTVQNCYSTGSVTGNDVVGGMVGHNDGTLQDCVALNPSITATDNTTFIGRIFGSSSTASTYTNYARDLAVNGSGYTPDIGLSRKDGATINATQWHTAGWWTSATNWYNSEWNTSIWSIGNGGLPRLLNMPGGLSAQNPVIK